MRSPATAPNLQASYGTYAEKVKITWDHDAAGFAESELYRATSLEGTKTLVYGGYSESYDDTNASPGVTYYYWAKV